MPLEINYYSIAGLLLAFKIYIKPPYCRRPPAQSKKNDAHAKPRKTPRLWRDRSYRSLKMRYYVFFAASPALIKGVKKTVMI